MNDTLTTSSQTASDDDPLWLDRARVYRAVHTLGGRITLLCFIPNFGTHDRYLPLSDLRLIDPSKDGTELILEFSSISVMVFGRYLRRIPYDIASGRCAALEAFDQQLRDMPEKQDAPFIESIQFFSATDEQSSNRGLSSSSNIVESLHVVCTSTPHADTEALSA